MPEISVLTKSVTDSLIFYPFKEIEDKEWTTYLLEGQWVEESKEWKEVGFRVPWPTPTRLKKLSALNFDVEYNQAKARLIAGDYAKLCKTIAYQLIQDVVGITDNGKPIDYSKSASKEWLYKEFLKSDFLMGHFYTEYQKIAGKIKDEEKKEEENFFGSSEVTFNESSPGTRSESKEVKDDTLPNLLTDE